jgi:hypothetical protein
MVGNLEVSCTLRQLIRSNERDGAALRLVTTEGIAGWLASMVDSGPVILESAVLSDALQHEMPDNFEVVHATCTIYEVRERFATYLDRGKLRLDAILITESGTFGESPIGLATAWDLLRTAP